MRSVIVSLALLIAALATLCAELSSSVAAPAPDGTAEAKKKLEALKKRMPEVLKTWMNSHHPEAGSYSVVLRRVRLVRKGQAQLTVEMLPAERPPSVASHLLTIHLSYYDGIWTARRFQWSNPGLGGGWEEAGHYLLDAIDEAAEVSTAKPSEAEMSRLIRQLGSANFAEREFATKAIRALGEEALPALKKASADKDPEVKRRATQLLKPLEAKARIREMERIVASKLSPREKGQRLKKLIPEGMSYKEVERILGECHDGTSFGNKDGGSGLISRYKEYGLQIHASSKADQNGYWVDSVELYGN